MASCVGGREHKKSDVTMIVTIALLHCCAFTANSTRMIRYLLLVCIQLLLLCEHLQAQKYRLELQLYNYSNPNSWNNQKVCCDIGSISETCYAPCETMFTICLRTGNTDHSDDSCPWSNHIRNSGILSGGDNLTFTSSVGNLNNPIVFEDNNLPQAGVQVYFKVEDNDQGCFDDDLCQNIVDLIDKIFIEVQKVTGTMTTSQEYSGDNDVATINLSYKLVCANTNYYGVDCSVFCEPRDNDTGHYTCNPVTGAKECLSGFVNPNTNCVCTTNNPNCLLTSTTAEKTSILPGSTSQTGIASMTTTIGIAETNTPEISAVITTSTSSITTKLTQTSTSLDLMVIGKKSHVNMQTIVGLSSSIKLNPTVVGGEAPGDTIVIIGVILAILFVLLLTGAGIIIFVLLIFRERRLAKTSSLPGALNGTLSNHYYSSAKDPELKGVKSLDNPIYGGEPDIDQKTIKEHTYEYLSTPVTNILSSGSYEDMQPGNDRISPIQYGTLYETPFDGAKFEKEQDNPQPLIDIHLDNELYGSVGLTTTNEDTYEIPLDSHPQDYEEAVFSPTNTVDSKQSYTLQNALYSQGKRASCPEDCEEPVLSPSPVGRQEDNIYVSMNYSDNTNAVPVQSTSAKEFTNYEIPKQANKYNPPWKKLI